MTLFGFVPIFLVSVPGYRSVSCIRSHGEAGHRSSALYKLQSSYVDLSRVKAGNKKRRLENCKLCVFSCRHSSDCTFLYTDRSVKHSHGTTHTMSTIADSAKCQYTYLGKSGLRVSNICLGAMTFGESTVSGVFSEI